VGNFSGKGPDNLWPMRSQATPAAISGADPATNIFDRLEQDWRRSLRSPAVHDEAEAWAVAEPALSGAGSAGEVVARVTWEGYHPSADGALVLSALLRQARSPLAARALLQALLPRIRAERVQTATYGHGVGESWPRPADTVADLVAECFAAIARHAGEDRGDVDRVIVGQAARRLRTARQAQRRHQSRTVALLPGHCALATGDISCARSRAELLAGALVEAVRGSRLTADQARLLYAARVKGIPASEVGRSHGLPPKAVYYALARAERTLLVSLARPGRAPTMRAA
jgi:DNA-directed RNA polymerase specialized sigma24 family protein